MHIITHEGIIGSHTHTHMAHTTNAAYTQNTLYEQMHTHTEHILVWLAFNLLEDIDAAIDIIEGRWIHKHTINMFQIKFL